MTSLAWLIPAALALGGLGLAGFLWSLKTGQYDDLDGAAWRALQDDAPADRARNAAAKTPHEADGAGDNDDSAQPK